MRAPLELLSTAVAGTSSHAHISTTRYAPATYVHITRSISRASRIEVCILLNNMYTYLHVMLSRIHELLAHMRRRAHAYYDDDDEEFNEIPYFVALCAFVYRVFEYGPFVRSFARIFSLLVQAR